MDKLDHVGGAKRIAETLIAKDERIAELEARILELETVTDEQVERAAKAYDDACMTPTFKPCPRCNGKGYHHGFGESGADPDWCDNCGGVGEIDADPLKPIRAALMAGR